MFPRLSSTGSPSRSMPVRISGPFVSNSTPHVLSTFAHAARKFTDTAKFDLRCLVCQCGLVGEKGAMEHAKKTGHTNFSEYK